MSGVRPVTRLAVRRVLLGGRRPLLVIGMVGVTVATAGILAGAPRSGPRLWDGALVPLAGGVALVVVTAGLASGERELTRAAAVLACNGASRRQQRLVRVVEGVLLGALGTAAGLAAALAVRPLMGPGARADDTTVTGLVIGLGSTVVAALTAGRRAGRSSVATAMAGRRPAGPVRPVAVVAAIGLVLAGTLVASLSRTWASMEVYVSAGSLLLAAGGGWLAAMALALAGPLADRARGGLRLATAGLARERYRTGPVAAVVAVVCGFALVAALLGESFDQREDRRREELARSPTADRLRDDQLLLRIPTFAVQFPASPDPSRTLDFSSEAARHLRDALPDGVVAAPLLVPERPTDPVSQGGVLFADQPGVPGILYDDRLSTGVVADDAVVRAMGLPPRVGRHLDAGRAVVLDPALVSDGEVRLWSVFGGASLEVPAVVAGEERAAADLPSVLVPPAAVERAGLDTRQIGVLVRAPTGLTPAVRRLVEDVRREEVARQRPGIAPMPAGVELVTPGPSSEWEEGRLDAGNLVPGTGTVRRLAVAGTVAAVAMVVFAVALTAVDRRRDDELLVALGAPARLRRRVGAVQAGALSAVGATVAVVAGTGAAAVGFASYNQAETGPPPIPFVFPWGVAVLLLVGLPLAAAGVSWLLTPTIREVDLGRLAD